MKYSFTKALITQGNRTFIKIPFNVWDVCHQKGNLRAVVTLQHNVFECKLVPKGEGEYMIPVPKVILQHLKKNQKLSVTLQIIDKLMRIDHDSPYTKEHPIRFIDHIQQQTCFKRGYCGQLCVAMLTGLSVDEVVQVMHAKAWQCSMSKLMETLDYYGIVHDETMTYPRGKPFQLPTCCIVTVRCKPRSTMVLYYHGVFYDEREIHEASIIGYLGIQTI